ncbi:MAG: DUF92 domain-containing protein [Thermoplasmata archaeon]|nr:DUF92 domain-containing protein [Candidatus Sysuiplasma acidicola]
MIAAADSDIISIVLSTALSYIAYWQGMLTAKGSVAAFAVSATVGVLGNLSWLLVILTFVLAAFITTRFKILEKAGRGLQEGKKGERGTINVIANSLPAVVVSVAGYIFVKSMPGWYFTIVFITAISAAASDTLASEVGVLDRNTRLITNLKRVPTGTDGGISVTGTLAALGGAVFISLVGFVMTGWIGYPIPVWSVPLISFLGFAGSNVDSLLGATLERRGIIGKQVNNIASITIVALIAALLLL